VRDRTYVSARWPGDAHTFAKTFAGMLANPRKLVVQMPSTGRETRPQLAFVADAWLAEYAKDDMNGAAFDALLR